MAYKQTNNPISRKTSPISKVNPYTKGLGGDKENKKPGVISIESPETASPSAHPEGQPNPHPLVGQPMPDVPYEEISDMEEAGAEQPDYEDPDYKPGMSRKSSSQEIPEATAQDSSFVKQNHPSFTGGFHAGASAEIKNLESGGTEVWPKWKQGIIQSHKRNEVKATKLAKNKGIDVENWLK